MTAADLMAHRSGSFLFSKYQPSIHIQHSSTVKFQFVKVSRTLLCQSFRSTRLINCATAGKGGRQKLSVDGFEHEPFWLSMVKDVVWGLRMLAVFLAEQPSQLKYIEWPTFQTTMTWAYSHLRPILDYVSCHNDLRTNAWTGNMKMNIP
ncbi:uncharacterized protein [Typha latifolia]|uniref:uncharacterized protein isoform X2 n=1 Tax=Typha latifolia TaxID=4733 RepID=UPI003C3068FB